MRLLLFLPHNTDMLFNSFSFVIFLPIVVASYYILPFAWRTSFLLIASSYFYMAFIPKYILILFFIITADYFLAFLIAGNEGRKKKLFLSLSIFINIGTLFFFKYFNFFNENIATLVNFFHFNYSPILLSVVLPLGLSFHVFQSLSYIIEVYRKKYTPEKNYLTYALYVMFFPQLVAGPIERPQHLLPQLSAHHLFKSENIIKGFERVLWGFFKKLVIADQLALVVNPMYEHMPEQGPLLVVLVILFAYQIYCDFSGYTDIALGSAMMLGVNLSENFNRPFSAQTVADFWRRWHMSLSSWIRDYLYYPLALGWGKSSKFKLFLSVLITFVLVGLWHGANWTYILFGVAQGVYLIVGLITGKKRKQISHYVGIDKFPRVHSIFKIFTVFILFAISLVLFRSSSVGQAVWIISHLFSNFSFSFITNSMFNQLTIGTGKLIFVVVILSIIIMEMVQYLQAKIGSVYIFSNLNPIIRNGIYYTLLFVIFLFGYSGAQTFIYFQF